MTYWNIAFLLFLLAPPTFAQSQPSSPAPAPTPNQTSTVTPGAPEAPFLEAFPNLKNYIFEEPKSGFYLGFGATPIGVMTDRVLFAADFFQLHWMSEHWNIEILNASYGFTQAQNTTLQSNQFTFRTAPKYKIGQLFSIGPVFGYEYVTFRNVGAKLFKTPWETQVFEPFSSSGIIYGGMISETFKYKNDYLIQFNELAYQQTYSVKKTPENWTYVYEDPSIEADPNVIGASFVILIQASFLY